MSTVPAGRKQNTLRQRCKRRYQSPLAYRPHSLRTTFVAMPTSALFLIFTVPFLLGLYVQRFRRATASQHAAALASLGLQVDDAHGKKKKFIGFFHPYW